MSTVMYAHRINKSALPALMRNARKWGETKSILAQIELEPETERNTWGDRIDMLAKDRRNGGDRWREWQQLEVEIQIFNRGPYYLLRPLQTPIGYMPRPEDSKRWQESYSQDLSRYLHGHRATRLVRYDNRVDIPPEDRRNGAIAKWLDTQITAGLFLIFNVVTLHDFEMRLHRRIWARADARK